MQILEVRVQEEDFNVSQELAKLRASGNGIGALATFIGVVRDLNGDQCINTITLEHYPDMTERSIKAIVEEAGKRWAVMGAIVVHRVGRLAPSEQIVLVAVASAHRGASFKACEFIMDYLKTQAPLWKKEDTPAGSVWVQARAADTQTATRWTNN
ncbi:MAG: molybdenum cofactor biosynthesis protein MoaE [Gammaproteobacteria bacterium]|nr:molybdenum cofactor biosynthesis protein MoaE [Gammaproteobacteria bacterium]